MDEIKAFRDIRAQLVLKKVTGRQLASNGHSDADGASSRTELHTVSSSEVRVHYSPVQSKQPAERFKMRWDGEWIVRVVHYRGHEPLEFGERLSPKILEFRPITARARRDPESGQRTSHSTPLNRCS